jgi:sulfur carrier protein ThiS
MEVTVKLYAGLQKNGKDRLSVRLSEPAVVDDLLRELGLARHDVELVAVNGVLAQFGATLHNGDMVSLMPFIGGG